MTEKRFRIEVDEENIAHILDNSTDIGQYNLCTLLNEQHEEIETLKQQVGNDYNEANSLTVRIANLTEELDYYKSKCGSLEEGYLKSQKENEQLKKALVELKEIGDYQEGRIRELNDENEQLRMSDTICDYETTIARLKEENEQLKKQVENLKFELRTIKAFDRTVKEEHSDSVYDFQKKLEKW